MRKSRARFDWPETAMLLAHSFADSRSQDIHTQVGACIINEDSSVLLGYNGAPPGIELDWSDREGRRPYVLHAESNVLDLAKPGSVKLMAVTHLPCSECLKRIAKYRIKTVYYVHRKYKSADATKSLKMAKFLGINLIQIDLDHMEREK